MFLEKEMRRAERMQKSEAARQRRKARKQMIEARTLNIFGKLRRLRKKNSK